MGAQTDKVGPGCPAIIISPNTTTQRRSGAGQLKSPSSARRTRALHILGAVRPAARAVIERAHRVEISQRDSLRVLELLENPPGPNKKLLAAAEALPAWRQEAISRKHDRNVFDWGDAKLNEYLRRYARQNHESGAVKTFLAVAEATAKRSSDFTA